MSNINAVGVANSAGFDGNQQRVAKKKELSQEDFMKLLLTQLKLQSPFKPYDSGEMLQQMSQMTSLTATQELEKTIKQMNVNMGNTQMLQASQLVGKKVQVFSETSPLVENVGLSGSVIVPKTLDDVSVTITDENGKAVKTISLGASSPGVLDFSWDGKDESGNQMKPGFYKISASATIDGQKQSLLTGGTFSVNSVALDRSNGSVILNVDGLGGIDMDAVIKII